MPDSPSTTAPALENQPASPAGRRSHGQVLKSSMAIGGSMGFGMAIGAVRAKVMALLLGPAGVGLFGMYWSISEMARSIAGMGVNNSGVRQIAEAAGTGDEQRIARTVTTLRRVALVLGGLGALAVAVFSPWISRLTFHDTAHSRDVALMALAVLFGEISAAQGALVQGLRRVADLARANIYGSFIGTLASIAIVYYYYRQGRPTDGVVPSLVCFAAMNIFWSWWYARKIKVPRVRMTAAQLRTELSGLLKLGLAFMSSGLLFIAAGYLVRVILLRLHGEEAAGYYQAAWGLAGMYVGFILQAMGADFLPRLSAVANNNPECNRLVNEQAEVGLLIALPGLLATLSIAPLVVTIFYSKHFGPSVEILRWICLGMVLRVASWPLGSIILAKGLRNLFVWTETLTYASYVALIAVCVPLLGIDGSGVAFFGMYALYATGIYFVSRRISGFRWSEANRKLAILFTPVVAGVFLSWYFLPHVAAAVLGTLATLGAGVYSLKLLCALVSLQRVPPLVRKCLVQFGFIPPAAQA